MLGDKTTAEIGGKKVENKYKSAHTRLAFVNTR